jgi:DNA polymerase-4
VTPAAPTRTILHVDMDAFFVSVELLERPDLVGRPVVVGGDGRRGVVAAANYEARRFGVTSAMPTLRARQRCRDLVVLRGRYERYAEVSARIMEVFTARTPLVEPIALDEAFLDVTGARRLLGDGPTIAAELRGEVYAREGLWCSVGVASTKFVAKLASQAAKPDGGPTRRSGGASTVADGASTTDVRAGSGVVAVPDDAVLAFLHPLPASALWGVGPATLERLRRHGLETVGDLAAVPPEVLEQVVGRAAGRQLHRLANGVDARPVEAGRRAKSVGHEQTYVADLRTGAEVDRELLRLADAVAARLATGGLAGATLTVKVRFGDFTTITRSQTPATPLATTRAIVDGAREVVAGIDPGPGIRLLGVSVSGLTAADASRQLSFEDLAGADPDGRGVQAAVDAIRQRWGSDAIGPAALLGPGGLGVRRRGDNPWGPTDERATPGGHEAGA